VEWGVPPPRYTEKKHSCPFAKKMKRLDVVRGNYSSLVAPVAARAPKSCLGAGSTSTTRTWRLHRLHSAGTFDRQISKTWAKRGGKRFAKQFKPIYGLTFQISAPRISHTLGIKIAISLEKEARIRKHFLPLLIQLRANKFKQNKKP